MEMMKNKPTIAGVVLAGLATGAAGWYLFGTSGGKEVCNKLAGSVKNMSEPIIDKAGDIISHLTGKAENVSDRVMA